MGLIILLVIVFIVVKAFGGRKKNREYQNEYQPKKKKGCFTSVLVVIFFFVVIVLFGSSSSPSDTEPSSTSAPAAVQKTTTTATAMPTSEPTTREEWVRLAAEEVYDDDLISVTWQQVDNEKDMIVIYCKFKDNFTNDLRRTNFMTDAKNMLRRISELGKNGMIEYGSCYIVGRTTYVDNYNNDFEGNAMEIRLLESDLSKLNWDNYMNNDTIINLATTYAVHPLFRD